MALDRSPIVRSWTKQHGIRIRYRLLGNRYRTYVPDILVEFNDDRRVLEEVKGKIWSPWVFEQKTLHALRYCSQRGMKFRVVFGNDLDIVT